MERREFELYFVTLNTKMDNILQRLMQLEKKFEIHSAISDYCPHSNK